MNPTKKAPVIGVIKISPLMKYGCRYGRLGILDIEIRRNPTLDERHDVYELERLAKTISISPYLQGQS